MTGFQNCFYGELVCGKRPRHGPKKRFKDCIKNNLKSFKIPVDDWETLAMNRSEWRKSINKGAEVFERERVDRAELKRGLRKGNISLPSDEISWKCETCSRVLLSKAGYVNHMKSHERAPTDVNTHLLPPQPGVTTCAVCEKTCKTTAGLKRHMKIHKDIIPQRSAVNPITVLDFICHICHRPCKSAAGLKSHLRAHGRTVNNEDGTNGEDNGRH